MYSTMRWPMVFGARLDSVMRDIPGKLRTIGATVSRSAVGPLDEGGDLLRQAEPPHAVAVSQDGVGGRVDDQVPAVGAADRHDGHPEPLADPGAPQRLVDDLAGAQRHLPHLGEPVPVADPPGL